MIISYWSSDVCSSDLFEEQGIDLARVRFEAASRNMAENARLTAALLDEEFGAAAGAEEAQPWLLVTSAWHMPRAVASFRAAGLAVLPYPVDFRTEPARLTWPREPGAPLGLAGIALHEWLGMVAYHLACHSEALFPAQRCRRPKQPASCE